VGGVVVRRGESGDFDAAWRIVSEYYEAVGVVVREDPAEFLAHYFGEGSGVWLARDGEEIVGCIALRPLEGIPAAGEVKRLYVKPPVRGRGIAGLLLDALHEYARRAGYTTLYLDSKDDLTDALRFYRNRGYRLCERYNDNPQATVFMQRAV
jgi:GNAT superfamily N-acetyltransferase